MDALAFSSDLSQHLKICVILTIITLLYWFLVKSKKHPNLPPAITELSWPILGHIPLLATDGYLKVDEWQKKHGSVFSLRYGKQNAVILGDFADIKAVYKMEGMTDRYPAMWDFGIKCPSLFEINGKEWMDHRRFAVWAIRGGDRDTSNEDIIKEELDKVFDSLKAKDLSKDIYLRKLIGVSANNVTLKMICGKSYEEDHPMTQFILDYNIYFQDYLSLNNLLANTHIPRILAKTLLSSYKRGMEYIIKMDQFIQSEISSHEKSLDSNNPRDYIDLFLIDLTKSEEKRKIQTYNQIRGDIQLLMIAGTDTVRVTVEWVTLFAAKYPALQEKAYREINDYLGARRPNWEDHINLPYTEAFIMECQRLALVLPMNVPRWAPRDIEIQGFHVPKGSLVIANFLAVHHDPKLWKDPETFEPLRFINESKRVSIPEFFVPFSIGSRNCLGDRLAKMELFLIVASIFQKYRILPPSGGVRLNGEIRISYIPKYPCVRLEKRINE